MKTWNKILLAAVFLIVFFFSAAYLFLIFKGKAIIIRELASLTHKKVTVSSLNVAPPLKLEIKDLRIEGLAKADYISLTPSILGCMFGKIALNDITLIKPEFTYEKTLPTSAGALSSASSLKPGPKLSNFIVKRIVIKDGSLNFIDWVVSSEGLKLTAKSINFTLNNTYQFPHSVVTRFELKGDIPWQEGQEEGKISFVGWLNLIKKDIKATLKITDIDGVYLYPYYSSWVDLGKARVEKAKLNFTSNIEGLNNNLTAQCHLELTDIVRKPRSSEESEGKAERIASVVLEIFRALNQGKIVLDFTVRTKIDRPEFGFGNIKMAVEDKVSKARRSESIKAQDVLAFPGNFLQRMFKGAADIWKAFFDGAVAVGQELQKTAEAAFRKEPKP